MLANVSMLAAIFLFLKKQDKGAREQIHLFALIFEQIAYSSTFIQVWFRVIKWSINREKRLCVILEI